MDKKFYGIGTFLLHKLNEDKIKVNLCFDKENEMEGQLLLRPLYT